MAKKPMKFKRYEGGGEVEESTAKQRGLDISNKEKPVGFFERIRMGNIDDPSSEAYKRFGAGRGRAAAAEEDRPRPVPRIPPKPNPIFAAGEAQGKRQPSGDASVAEDYSGPRTKPIVATETKKPAVSKPKETKSESKPPKYDGPMRGMRSDTRTSGTDKRGETDMSNYKARRSSGSPSTDGRGETDMSNYKARRSSGSPSTDGRGETDMSKYKSRRSSDTPDMSAYTARRTPGPLSDILRPGTNVNYENDDTDDMTYKRGGKVKKYASGGTVSAASKRADGIASKGKTRCKIC